MNWAKRVAVCVEHQTVFRNRKIAVEHMHKEKCNDVIFFKVE